MRQLSLIAIILFGLYSCKRDEEIIPSTSPPRAIVADTTVNLDIYLLDVQNGAYPGSFSAPYLITECQGISLDTMYLNSQAAGIVTPTDSALCAGSFVPNLVRALKISTQDTTFLEVYSGSLMAKWVVNEDGIISLRSSISNIYSTFCPTDSATENYSKGFIIN
ncbi:MAG: hypothetical protein JWO09_142 [Bacteroidetes bacterium]|nr:hypothetical protein [Bacteroidota bacterium]